MRVPALLLTMLALVVAAFSGCGKSASPASSSAASLAPANAAVYGEATLDPSGDQEQALKQLLAKFPGGDAVGGKLQETIERALDESDAPISYEDDVKPWLGDEAAVFVGDFGLGFKPRDVGVLLATDDASKALDAVKKVEPKSRDASYEGHDYLSFDDHGTTIAAGVLDDWLVLGTVEGFKAAVTASQGEGLQGTDRYEHALEGADPDRLGLVYADPKALAQLVSQAPGGAQALESLKGSLDQPLVVTLSVDADGAEIATQTPASSASSLGSFFGKGSDLVGDVPADSWLAFGQPDLGKTLDASLDGLAKQLGGREAIDRQVRGVSGLGLDDVTGWMGDFSIFVRGDGVSELNGALVVETTDEDASSRTLKALERLARSAGDGTRVLPLGIPGDGFALASSDVPQRVYAFGRDDHVVIAYGEAAARDALDASDRLSDSSGFKAAESSLGDGYDVSSWISVPPILKLVDSTGAGSDGDWAQVERYLEPLGALLVGGKQDGDEISSILRVTVP
jgi:hypothetical protein